MTAGGLTVSPTGLLFLGVVVLWAVYLVPIWVRDRTRAMEERHAEREAELLRLADGTQPRVVLTTGEPSLTSTGRLNAVATATDEVRRARRALRRGRAMRASALFTGLLLAVVSTVVAVAGVVPWWAPLGAAGWLVTTTSAGGVVASHERRRLRAAKRRVRTARSLQPVAPDRSRPVPLFDRGHDLPPIPLREEDGVRVERLWMPVDVPRPTYTTAPRVSQAPPVPWEDPARTDEEPDADSEEAARTSAAIQDDVRRAASRVARQRATQRRQVAG